MQTLKSTHEHKKNVFFKGKISSIKYFLTVYQCVFPVSQSTVNFHFTFSERKLGISGSQIIPNIIEDSDLTPCTLTTLRVCKDQLGVLQLL